jgi:hypothetical protein
VKARLAAIRRNLQSSSRNELVTRARDLGLLRP